MAVCPLPTYSSLLHPLAAWCLDTFGEGPPMLVGVAFGDTQVRFHPIELCDLDPLHDLAGLIAPDDWDALVVIAPTCEAQRQTPNGTVAHAVDRTGRSATELDDPCGHRRSLHVLRGRLHDTCLTVLAGC